MYTYAVSVISWAMWVYSKTEEFRLVSCYWCKGFKIISDAVKEICISFVSFSFRCIAELKLLQNLKSEAAWA